MTRESRIARARQMAAETSDARASEREEEESRRTSEIASRGSAAAIAAANQLRMDDSVGYLGPQATEYEWNVALKAARLVVVEAARRGQTLTYGELQLAAVRSTGLQIGYSMYGTFCMELNQPGLDGCLISSIVVGADTGEPGPGLIPFAQSIGIDKPIAVLQRDVFDRFAKE